MRCPKCDSDFERVVFENIEVDRCKLCKGIWFDMLEKEDLVSLAGSEQIDTGNEAHGKRYDQLRQISCPVCHMAMISMVDKDQTHIHYESCPSCYGTFFDAGEFKDLKYFNPLERISELVKTLRHNL